LDGGCLGKWLIINSIGRHPLFDLPKIFDQQDLSIGLWALMGANQ
jgi:hypothetical protein